MKQKIFFYLIFGYLVLIFIFSRISSCDANANKKFVSHISQNITTKGKLFIKNIYQYQADKTYDKDLLGATASYYDIVSNNEYLVKLDRKTSELIFYNINIGEIGTLKFHFKVPEGISKFYVYNLDSIFFFSKELLSIYLYNSKGIELSRYSLKENIPANYRNFSLDLFDKKSNPIFYDNNFYFSIIKNSESYINNSGIIVFHLKNNVIDTSFILKKYPSKYSMIDIFNRNYGIGFCSNNNQLITSFAYDDTIYSTQINGNESAFYAGSSNFDEFKIYDDKIDKDEPDFQQRAYYYENIIYNQFKDVYYRIVHLGCTEDDMEKPYAYRINKWSIIALDGKFNKLSETIMNQYDNDWKPLYQEVASCKEGLLVRSFPEDRKYYKSFLITYLLLDYAN